MIGLDKEAKEATFACGAKIQYEALLSTMPLDLTLRKLGKPEWAKELSHRQAFGLKLNTYACQKSALELITSQ